jgi:hypothetical protein
MLRQSFRLHQLVDERSHAFRLIRFSCAMLRSRHVLVESLDHVEDLIPSACVLIKCETYLVRQPLNTLRTMLLLLIAETFLHHVIPMFLYRVNGAFCAFPNES